MERTATAQRTSSHSSRGGMCHRPHGICAWSFFLARILTISVLAVLLGLICDYVAFKKPAKDLRGILIATLAVTIIALCWSIVSILAKGWSRRYIRYATTFTIDACILVAFVTLAIFVGIALSGTVCAVSAAQGKASCVDLTAAWVLTMTVPGLFIISAGSLMCLHLEGRRRGGVTKVAGVTGSGSAGLGVGGASNNLPDEMELGEIDIKSAGRRSLTTQSSQTSPGPQKIEHHGGLPPATPPPAQSPVMDRALPTNPGSWTLSQPEGQAMTTAHAEFFAELQQYEQQPSSSSDRS